VKPHHYEVGLTSVADRRIVLISKEDKGLVSRRGVPVLVAIVATAFLGGACGGTGSPGVASLGASTTSTAAPETNANGQSSKIAADDLAFAQCMQTSGVPNFPNPVISSNRISIHVGKAPGVEPDSHQYRSALSACKHFLPNGGAGPTITSADQADYLKGVACLRAHGFPQFPDPTFTQTHVSFKIPQSIKLRTSQFEHAVGICDKLVPAGLPYSGL
jgi:hypothetical protein